MHDARNAVAATLEPLFQVLRLAALVVCVGWIAGTLAQVTTPDVPTAAVAAR